MPKATLDDRIARGLGLPSLSREALDAHRLLALNATLARVVRESPFYARRLSDVRLPLPSLEAVAGLPFTTPEDLAREPESFRCVAPGEVERVVTLRSSGTTAPPKRVFFSRSDIDDTRAYFAAGLTTLVDPGDAVFVLYPSETPNSVGELLGKAAGDIGARAIFPVAGEDFRALSARLGRERVRLLAGDPIQLVAFARFGRFFGTGFRASRVLLSADSVPTSLRRAVESDLGAEVFAHYGSRETGYGGGLECAAHGGYHMREADLLVEAVPHGGAHPAVPGEAGELVVTTLRREAFPLVRYRTGDEGRRAAAPCPCGTLLETWTDVRRIGRESLPTPLESRNTLEEEAFTLPFVLDIRILATEDRIRIALDTLPLPASADADLEPLRRSAAAVGSVRVTLEIREIAEPDLSPRPKRRIERTDSSSSQHD